DSIAVHIKLNELVASNDKASNRRVDVEGLSEDELRTISKYFEKLAELTRNESDVHESHSIDDASDNHNEKMKGSKRSGK
nr:low affinity iron permease family protein [Bacteroidia bacterium]